MLRGEEDQLDQARVFCCCCCCSIEKCGGTRVRPTDLNLQGGRQIFAPIPTSTEDVAPAGVDHHHHHHNSTNLPFDHFPSIERSLNQSNI